MTDLSAYIHAAQAAPVFDPSALLTQGPLGVLAVFMFYLWRRSEDRLDKERDVHRVEMAEQRKLNVDQQDKRLEDHKVLLPLAQSLVKVAEQMVDEYRELTK